MWKSYTVIYDFFSSKLLYTYTYVSVVQIHIFINNNSHLLLEGQQSSASVVSVNKRNLMIDLNIGYNNLYPMFRYVKPVFERRVFQPKFNNIESNYFKHF